MGKKPSTAARIIGPILGVIVIAAMLFYTKIMPEKQLDTQVSGTSTSAAEEDVRQTIMDENGIKITYTGFLIQEYMPQTYMITVGLTIENSSDIDVVVAPEYGQSSVNGIMKVAVSGMQMTALSGKKAITGFSFANLDGLDINATTDTDKIEEIEFKLSIMDNESFNELFTSDTITITP